MEGMTMKADNRPQVALTAALQSLDSHGAVGVLTDVEADSARAWISWILLGGIKPADDVPESLVVQYAVRCALRYGLQVGFGFHGPTLPADVAERSRVLN
jgi:hypothetical protein